MVISEETQPDHNIDDVTAHDRRAELQLQKSLRLQFGDSAPVINCSCSRGVLALHGHVKNQYQKHMAQKLARRVAGVRFIVNNLVVDAPLDAKQANETFCPDPSPHVLSILE